MIWRKFDKTNLPPAGKKVITACNQNYEIEIVYRNNKQKENVKAIYDWLDQAPKSLKDSDDWVDIVASVISRDEIQYWAEFEEAPTDADELV